MNSSIEESYIMLSMDQRTAVWHTISTLKACRTHEFLQDSLRHHLRVQMPDKPEVLTANFTYAIKTLSELPSTNFTHASYVVHDIVNVGFFIKIVLHRPFGSPRCLRVKFGLLAIPKA